MKMRVNGYFEFISLSDDFFFINRLSYFVVIDDLLTFKLPPDQLPGTDQLSRSILKKSSAIDIITSDLLNVPKGTYTIASTEWDNGSRSNIL
jgi:hypothetical protein